MHDLSDEDRMLIQFHAKRIADRMGHGEAASGFAEIHRHLLAYAEAQGMPAVQRQIDLQNQMAASYRARQSHRGRRGHAW